MTRVTSGLIAAAIISLAGCDGGGAPATVNATLRARLGGEFSGSYVRIRGARALAADPMYPCLSQFDVCVPLSAAGSTDAIPDLCPTLDTPTANWSFTYSLYTDEGCTGELANLSCVPHTSESLASGDNLNAVECQSRNADKGYEFCVVDPITGAGRENCPDELREILVLEPTIASRPAGVAKSATVVAIEELGFLPVVKTAAEWGAMTTPDFASYRAIVLADPLNNSATDCTVSPAAFAAAEANTAVWGPAVNGNVLILGADPTFHVDVRRPSLEGAQELIKDGINFAAWKPYQTGLYVGLACAYYTASSAALPVLSYFGSFQVDGMNSNESRIVGAAEPFTGLTDADLSGWYTSAHEYMTSISVPPGDFKPFAVATDASGVERPYIIGRGLD